MGEDGHWIHTRNRSMSRSNSIEHLDPRFGRAANAPSPECEPMRTKEDFDRVLNQAAAIYDKAVRYGRRQDTGSKIIDFTDDFISKEAHKDIWWMLPSDAVRLMQDTEET